jgi:hypothetical protein
MDFASFLPTPSIPLVAILVGSALIGAHLFGTLLLACSALWLFAIVSKTDLGEFSPMRHIVLIAIAAGSFLVWKFVPDFLSSRAVGFLLLLAAHPVLETTFLQTGLLHFALALLAYAWAVTGLFLVGMPYLQRDLIGWVSGKTWRWNLACWIGILYGLLLLIDGVRLVLLD